MFYYLVTSYCKKKKKLVALNFGHGSNSIRENILSGQTGHPKSHHVQKNANCDFKSIDIFQRSKLAELFSFFKNEWITATSGLVFFLKKDHEWTYFFFLIDDYIFENVNDPYHLISTFFYFTICRKIQGKSPVFFYINPPSPVKMIMNLVGNSICHSM